VPFQKSAFKSVLPKKGLLKEPFQEKYTITPKMELEMHVVTQYGGGTGIVRGVVLGFVVGM
jgi:hypothetical protein